VADSICISDDPVVLFCPDTENENTTAPILAELESGSYPQVRCRPCGGLTVESDKHPGRGKYTGLVNFGPNEVNGAIDESDISEYRVHWGDASGHILGEAAGSIAVMNNTLDCCIGIYSVQLSGAKIPLGAATLIVVSVDLIGFPMPVGLSTPVSDWIVTTTKTTTPPPSCCATRKCPCEIAFGPSPSGSGSENVEESAAPRGWLGAWPTLFSGVLVLLASEWLHAH